MQDGSSRPSAASALTHVNEVAVERVEHKLLQLLVRMSSPGGFGRCV